MPAQTLSARQSAHKAALWLDDLFFPENVSCLCCQSALGEGEWLNLCPACTEALNRLFEKQEADDSILPPQGIEYAFAAFPYTDAAKTLILLLKYGSIRAAANPLAVAMSTRFCGKADILVPVPTTKRRLRERGYNQAQVLAQTLHPLMDLPVVPALTRQNEQVSQTALSAEERRRNLIGCMTSDAVVAGKRVLLIDDVLTTGSTAAEAARALHAAGAASVSLLVAAKTSQNDAPLFQPERFIPNYFPADRTKT